MVEGIEDEAMREKNFPDGAYGSNKFSFQTNALICHCMSRGRGMHLYRNSRLHI